jgi:hypothetical protein
MVQHGTFADRTSAPGAERSAQATPWPALEAAAGPAGRRRLGRQEFRRRQSLGAFNPLFPKGAYFNESGLTSWSNLVAIRPALACRPAAVTLEVSYLDRARMTPGDAIYLQPAAVLPSSAASRAKAVGQALQVDASWQINRNLKVQGQLVHQSVADAVQALGGRSVDFAMLIVQARF